VTAHQLPVAAPETFETRDILGVPVASLDWSEAIALLARRLEERRFTPVGFMNAHNANVASRDPEFARALAGFLILPDGVGVDIASKVLYGKAFPANLNGTDFVPGFLAASAQPLTVGLLGATRRNAEGAAHAFQQLTPHHRFIVVHDGFFRPAEEPAILARLEELKPDVLLVAMGVPRQEFWIAQNIGPQHCLVPIAVGALLDFMSGAVPRAPALVRRLRAEWLFRLYVEPGRLWRRYIFGNPAFIVRIVAQKLGLIGAAG